MPPWVLRLWPLFAFLAFIIFVKFALDEYNSAQESAAQSKVVITQQGKVIENATNANAARNAVLDPSAFTNYCQCLRTSRTAGSCKRYLPNDAKNIDEPASMCPKR